jgi:competence protein ComEC
MRPTSDKSRLRQAFANEEERLILFLPVCLGLGMAWYFHLRYEPPRWWGLAGCFVSLSALTLMRRHLLARYGLIAAFLFALGLTLAQARVEWVSAPFLHHVIPSAWITGRIADIAPTPQGSKLTLEDIHCDKILPTETPRRIRLSLRSYDAKLAAGAVVTLHAGLFPPPSPALPGGFDFSRYFYFERIGAVGYGMGKPILHAETQAQPDASARFADFRHRLTEAIRRYFHEPAGAVASAFITGETRAIPDAVNDDMRIAGLYHLLAVSGMNLSVVAGLAFYSFRLLLALFPMLALRFPIKKHAALLALFASYAYLRVSGAPVSAERAFLMVSLIFLAILFDRDPAPLRSLMIAGAIVLIHTPEAVLSASFQLSFSATASLLSSYELFARLQRRKNSLPRFSLPAFGFYFLAVLLTSLVAWAGTEPFIVYHFSQMSLYSLIANTLAEPLVSFILMPLVIAGTLLLPFGLAKLMFTPLQYGVDWLLALAHFIAHLPYAMFVLPPPSDGGFLIFTLGLSVVYFLGTKLRWLGLIPVALGLATMVFYRPPDLFIDATGKHAAIRMESGAVEMLAGKETGLDAQAWRRAALTLEEATKTACTRLSCRAALKGRAILLLKKPEALSEICAADIVIASFPVPASFCPRALLFDAAFLARSGAVTLYLTRERIETRFAHLEQGIRPWVVP